MKSLLKEEDVKKEYWNHYGDISKGNFKNKRSKLKNFERASLLLESAARQAGPIIAMALNPRIKSEVQL